MYVALILVLGIFLALILNHKVKGITFFRAAFFLPAVLCGVTVGLIYGQIFYRIVPTVGKALGIEALSTNILGSKQLAIYGILFVSVWQGLAMPTVLFLAGLQTIPTDLYESAMIVACGTGSLELIEIQAPGAKRMTAKAYLTGKKIETGTRFGADEEKK